MIRFVFFLCLIWIAFQTVPAQALKLPGDGQRFLKNRFRSWKPAEIQPAILEYNRRERPFEQPNLIRGDWNGDGRMDYAVLLENRKNTENRITVVLMRRRSGFKTYILEGLDGLMAFKKGEKDYDYETQRSFRYKRDAVFSYIWEKAGSSYVFERGRFRAIITSD